MTNYRPSMKILRHFKREKGFVTFVRNKTLKSEISIISLKVMTEMNGLGTKKMERYTWEQSLTLDPVRVLHKLP